MVVAVEAASALLGERAGALILVASIVLSGALALIAVDSGSRWLDFAATIFAGLSVFLLLDGQLVYVGRDVLGLEPSATSLETGDGVPEHMSNRLAQKAVVISLGAAFLAVAVLLLLIAAAFVVI